MEPPTTRNPGTNKSKSEFVSAATAVLAGHGHKGPLARLWPFLGPAFIASVAYIDPGNFATNIQAGAQLGYTLLWVVTASNLMAMLIQAQSAKLGIITGMNLAELCRAHFSKPLAWGMWILMELVAMATDLAEFLGAALGFHLLLGMPLLPAGLLTAVTTFLILGLERYGFRPLERVIASLAGVVAVSYVIETVLDRPDWNRVLYHAVVPQLPGEGGAFLAAGILGATVMPHAIFLHSALTQDRIVAKDPIQMKRLFRFEVVDVLVAMGIAGMINAALLIMAASTFFKHGFTGVSTLEQADQTLRPLLGPAAGVVFSLSLLASGLSSSSVGTMAGHRRIPVWLRRLVTILPSLVVIASGLDPTDSMVLSQVVLSFGLPFALVPLVLFTSSKKIMRTMTNHWLTTLLLSLSTALVIALNLYLLYGIFKG
jgi:manganese transport protein